MGLATWMTWNYRVVRRIYSTGGVVDESLLGIHEVYYGADGEIKNWSVEAMVPGGETLEELESDLLAMRVAIGMGVLEEKDNTLVPITTAADGSASDARQEKEDKADNQE